MEEYQVSAILTHISEKLGVGVTHIWNALILQAKISAVWDLVWYSLIIALSVWWWKNYQSYKNQLEPVSSDDWSVGFKLAAVLIGLLIFAAMCSVPNTIAGFINPEYSAITDLMRMLKHLK